MPPDAAGAEPLPVDPALLQQRLAMMAELARLARFLIVGRGKSGTTWLARIFRSHPTVFLLGERKLVERTGDYQPPLRHFLDAQVMDTWGLHTSFRGRLEPRRLGPDLWRLVEDYLLAATLVAAGTNTARLTHLGDKLALLDPDDAAAILPNLERAHPGYRAIHIVRDGRDVAVSGLFHVYRNRVVKGGETAGIIKTKVERVLAGEANRLFTDQHLVTRAKSWDGVATAIDDLLRPALGERYILVRYEDLLADTRPWVERLFDFVGLPHTPQSLDHVVAQTSFKEMSGGRQTGEQDVGSGRRKGQAGDWVNYFTPRDRALFSAAAQPALERFGYEPDASWVEAG